MTVIQQESAARLAENVELAQALEHIAELLQAQQASPYRIAAYRRAAATIRELSTPMVDLFSAEGSAGLERLPGIGQSIGSLLCEYARSGRISLLERLEGDVSAEEVFAAVPGVGPVLAHQIHEQLGVETLEELELACNDGRLSVLHGFGPRRLAAMEASLSAMLGGASRRWVARARRERPSVAALLDVDREYRSRARSGGLTRIAPRRFNPERRAWLPILHAEREGWALTVLYSNTARAHRLGRTRDWVVIFADRGSERDQCTVVWQHRGGESYRVVRGRELECEFTEAERQGLADACDAAR